VERRRLPAQQHDQHDQHNQPTNTNTLSSHSRWSICVRPHQRPELLHLLACCGVGESGRDEADLIITALRLGFCGYVVHWPLIPRPLCSVMHMQWSAMLCSAQAHRYSQASSSQHRMGPSIASSYPLHPSCCFVTSSPRTPSSSGPSEQC
jgi:hypothetical protein